jgi:hypothetical protein
LSIHSPDSPEVNQRVMALMVVARDGRMTRQVREAALRELKEIQTQRQQRQRGDRTVTAVSPSVPAQYLRRIMPAPVSILSENKAAEPGSEEVHQNDRERFQAFLEHARELGDTERVQWAEERLEKLANSTPAHEPGKPTEKSGYEKLRRYLYGDPPEPTPQPIKVDFAGSIPGNTFWDSEEREARGSALSATRSTPAGPRIRVWGDDSDLPWSNEF